MILTFKCTIHTCTTFKQTKSETFIFLLLKKILKMGQTRCYMYQMKGFFIVFNKVNQKLTYDTNKSHEIPVFERY